VQFIEILGINSKEFFERYKKLKVTSKKTFIEVFKTNELLDNA